MKLQQLVCFTTVANTQNFTSAARNLFLSQPSVSYNISELEKELGVSLIERGFNNNAIKLTAQGIQLYEIASNIIRLSHECDCYFESIREDSKNALSILCSECLIYNVIPELIQIAASGEISKYPINLKIFPSYSVQDVEISINNETAVFALYTELPTETVSYIELFDTPLWAFIPANHPLSSQKSITLNQLDALPFLPPAQSEQNLTQHIDMMLESEGIIPKYFNGTNGILQDRLAYVSVGQCFTISTDWHVNSKFIAKIPIDNQYNRMPVYAIWKKNKLLPENASRLIKYCEKFKRVESPDS